MQSCSKFIKPIHALSLDDIGGYGAKAARLGEITRLGYRVPDGVCLSSVAFERFLSHNRLHGTIETILASAKSAELCNFQSCENMTADAFCAGDMPVEVAEAILCSWRSLGMIPMARMLGHRWEVFVFMMRCGKGSSTVALQYSMISHALAKSLDIGNVLD